MSVVLGKLKDDPKVPTYEVHVYADEYDADSLYIEDTRNNCIDLSLRQLQELSIIIDRFMDR